ncbi:hypothetical protein M569_10329 [Genlisea aurea]|uniref:BURP domain-containing protein n=1 Tax=Genlisea aurea TaxID=192259 RepID=S8DX19_9LAMI|nr:hypothetical protein M569_10329 [Genlisea aurea]
MRACDVFILVAAAAANEPSSTPEDYWKANLPNSPIPQFIRHLLTSTPSDESIIDEKRRTTSWSHAGEHVAGDKHGAHFNEDLSDQEDNPSLSLIFFQQDLRIGKSMNLNFRKPSDLAPFLPRHLADSIPFSSKNFSQILQKFSLVPDSPKARVLKTTLHDCEVKAVRGEEIFCPTSLESMIDFTFSRLGKPAIPLSTNPNAARTRQYRITRVKKSSDAKGLVACHGLPYAYAVFLCHRVTNAAAYEVELTAADDGSKSDAVAVCHMDTSEWGSNHVAFRVLGVKPGEVPVCHFLEEEGNVIWVHAK